MDESHNQNLEEYESLFSQEVAKASSAIYNHQRLSENTNQCRYTVKDILENVKYSLKAIQKADCVITDRNVRMKLQPYKKSSLVPLNLLPVPREEPPITVNTNKFETQCVTDTQLIDVVDNAEALLQVDMSNEFETTFCSEETKTDEIGFKVIIPPDTGNNNKSPVKRTETENLETELLERNKSKKETYSIEKEISNDIGDIVEDVLNASLVFPTKIKEPKSKNLDLVIKMNTQEEDTVTTTQLMNESIDIERNLEHLGIVLEEELNRPSSPVFNLNTHKRKISQHLVFSLEKFENFEMLSKQYLACENDSENAALMINSESSQISIRLPSDLERSNDFDEALSLILNNEEENCNYESDEIDDKATVIKPCPYTKERSNILKSVTPSMRDYEIFEDEILFSSDEELNYAHKSILKDPLTCALETSVYIGNSDILDKTMFVGFQTASNKSIQIGLDSFGKAQNILSEVENTERKIPVSLTELVAQCDGLMSDRKPDNKLTPPIHEENVTNSDLKTIIVEKNNVPEDNLFETQKEQVLNTIEIKFDSQKSNEPRRLKGFKTASHKNICLSEKGLSVVKNVFQDMDINDIVDMNINKHSPAKLDTNCTTAANDDCDDELILNEFKNDIIAEELNCKKSENNNNPSEHSEYLEHDEKTCFVGFKTACNKDIKISDKALAKTKSIFEDIDTDNHISITETYALKRVKENIHHDLENHNGTLNTENTFIGFKTASCKPIEISKKALAKTKIIFHDIDTESNEDDSNYVGFEVKSRSDTQKVASDDCKKTSSHNDGLYIVNKSKNKEFVGFRTASNKQLVISNKSLATTRSVFKDIIDLNDQFHKEDIMTRDFERFQTDNKKEQKGPEKVTTETKNICEDINMNLSSTNKGKYKRFVGFQTASNKKIKVSDEALAKCSEVFHDINTSSSKENILPDNNGIYGNGNNGATMLDNNESLSKNHKECGFVGCLTASKVQKVAVSKEAIAKTKTVFQDIDIDDVPFNQNDKEDKNDANKGFVGFKTANNKNVHISEEALAKRERLWQEINNVGSINNPRATNGTTESCVGFKTASNKTVTVSNKSRKIFDIFGDESGFDPIEKNKTEFMGFQTASNKQVKISEEALKITKNVFEDICPSQIENICVDKQSNVDKINTKFTGFQTASNKKVNMSEEALKNTKSVFQDIGLSQIEKTCIEKQSKIEKINTKFSGFQTASNKKVNISEEALKNTKSFFQDIGLSQIEKICIEKQSKIEKINTKFTGFQTASNKTVKISEEALKKTKSVFQDIDLCKIENLTASVSSFHTASDKKNTNNNEESKTIFYDVRDDKAKKCDRNTFGGFQTANKKEIKISDSALAETSNIFKDIEPYENNKLITENNKEKCVTKETDLETDKYLNTQVLNNFEETLNTEDFLKTPNKPKRSGSPILSCPKAKKSKIFQTPYKVAAKFDTPKIIPEEKAKPEKVLSFNKTYKSNKILKLIDIQMLENSSSDVVTIDPYIKTFDFDNLLKFEFAGERNTLSEAKLRTDDLITYFLESVNKKIVPDGWLDNHLRLIIWKLIHYELRFPKSMARACNTTNVIEQLKYRYDRELYNVERPALRKILEKDEVASRTMVLCVAAVYADGVSVARVPEHASLLELLLTDGWYTVRSVVGGRLARLVRRGRLAVGGKLVMCGAELDGCQQPVCAWEDTSKVRLKMFGNSTRPARWDARLGFHGNGAILSRLSAVKVDGGKVTRMRVFVTRVYPTLYVEKFDDGSTVTRSERLEQIYQNKYEAERQARLETIYEEIEREMQDETSDDSELSQDAGGKRARLDTGSQVAKMMRRSNDPEEFRSKLTSSQLRLLTDYATSGGQYTEHKRAMLEQRVRTSEAASRRNVLALVKARVCDCTDTGHTTATLSIWRPGEAILEILQEGAWIEVMNVVPTAVRHSELQISAGRQSTFNKVKVKETVKTKAYLETLSRKCLEIKTIAQNPALKTENNEIDTVGLIFLIDPPTAEFDSESNKNQHFQNVYLTDTDKNMICVNFWGGIKKFGFENILDTGQIVSGINLQKRLGNTKKNIPQYRATEFSYFTKTPKSNKARRMIDDLAKKLNGIDRRKFCDDCVELKNNFSVLKNQNNTENVSPYRFNNYHDLTKNKIFIDSPLAQKPKEVSDLDLTGLDFESTFKQRDTQDMSPDKLKRKKLVKDKIARLKMYGEPPPLSPIHIINKSANATKAFKSPLLSNNNSALILPGDSPISTLQNHHTKDNKSVASISNQNLPLHSAKSDDGALNSNRIVNNDGSPVTGLNRTYVNRIGGNPVKLNFSNSSMLEKSVDHFAEEFDGSPPLSLD